jgi:L-ascorbate metabolism protein UlaG (beta-lactamase superfamily)
MIQAMDICVTYIGTATVLLEIDGLRILTDPAFDPPGSKYWVRGFRTVYSTKVIGPAIAMEDLGEIDAVLLSHEHHFDNLDTLGRIVASRAKQVITTRSGSAHFRSNGVGLRPWQATRLITPGGKQLEVIATPARHGPLWMTPLLGDNIGFVIRALGKLEGGLYISGDTVLYGGLNAIRDRLRPDTGFLHIGAGRFRTTGKIRYSMDATEALRAAQRLGLRRFYPIHYDGWTHFSESQEDARRIFASLAGSERICWLEPGQRTQIERASQDEGTRRLRAI